MALVEHQGLTGVLTIVARDERGIVVERRQVKNLITTAGKLLLANSLLGLAPVPQTWDIVAGTGAANPASLTDTQLEAESSRASDPQPTIAVNSGVPTITVTATLPNGTAKLQEAGIEVTTAQSPPATLFNRVTFPLINQSPGMTLTFSWAISF